MTARSALMQVGGVSYLGRARAEAGLSVMTGLHYETKLHSMQADSVPILQCKRDVVGVKKRSLSRKGTLQRRRPPR
jgi:hypothetical protein